MSSTAAEQRTWLFEKEKISKAVFRLSIPTICSNLVMILYSLADTFFVGMINSPAQSAAVSIVSPVLLAFNAINNLFGVGASSMMSRALGARDYKTLKQSSAFGFYGSLICGVIFSMAAALFIEPLVRLLGASEETLAPSERYLLWAVILGAPFSILNVVMGYLVRAEGNTLQASIGTMSGAFINIILDPIFILIFGMKAEGAALATMISNVCACLYFFGYLYFRRKTTLVCIDWHEFGFRKKIVSGVCAVGIPASIQNLLNVISQILMNNIAAFYGTVAVAALGIAFRSSQVLMYVGMGISQGVMPLIGYTYAARMVDRMKKCIFYTMKLSVTVLFCLTVLYELFPSEIMSAFIGDPDTIAIGSVLIRGMALANPFLAVDFMNVGIFQACGKGKQSLILAILRKGVFEIPFMFLFTNLIGINGIGFSALAAEVLMSLISLMMLRSLLKKIERQDKAAEML